MWLEWITSPQSLISHLSNALAASGDFFVRRIFVHPTVGKSFAEPAVGKSQREAAIVRPAARIRCSCGPSRIRCRAVSSPSRAERQSESECLLPRRALAAFEISRDFSSPRFVRAADFNSRTSALVLARRCDFIHASVSVPAGMVRKRIGRAGFAGPRSS